MNKQLSRAGALLAIAISLAGTAAAEGKFTGNVALTTEYVWRGVSQSGGDFAIQGGFDYTNSIFYAGVWAANVDFDDPSDANLEVDFYAGLASTLENGVSWDIGVIHYAYPDAESTDINFTEIKGALGYAFEGGLSLGGEAYYDFDNENIYLTAKAGLSLSEALGVDASIGNYQLDAGGDYTDWSLGGTLSYSGFAFDLRYWDTDIDGSPLADERVVLTISRSL